MRQDVLYTNCKCVHVSGKGKAAPHLNRALKVDEGNAFLTSPRNGGECSASRAGRLAPAVSYRCSFECCGLNKDVLPKVSSELSLKQNYQFLSYQIIFSPIYSVYFMLFILYIFL